MPPHSSHASAAVSRLTPRNTRRPAASASRIARASVGVIGSRRRIPRVSATLTAGHAAGGAAASSIRRASARHHVSTLGVAEVSTSATGSRRARSSTTSRVWMRGAPGGLCAGSCSSISARRLPAASGASSAERVPTARCARPSASARHPAARSSSSAPESSRTTRPSFPRRVAQRAAASMSGTSTRLGPVAAPMRSSSRRSRPWPTKSWGRAASGAPAVSRGAVVPPRSGGGSSAAHVEPSVDRLCVAIHRARSSCALERIGAGSTTAPSGLRVASLPSRTATTRPTRGPPCSGARTRWPGASVQSSGTRYENG